MQTYQYKRIETTMSSATKSIPVHPIEIFIVTTRLSFRILWNKQAREKCAFGII